MFMESLGLAVGCEDCSLVDCRGMSEGAEEIAVERRFHSEIVLGKEWKRAW